MAHFVEQYTDMLKACDDYDSLANAIKICISKNIINAVSSDIKDAIDSLGLSTPYYRFMKTMVWAASVSDHTETSLNLLRYFCNKIAKEYNSLTLEPDEFSLMIITICADDKQFLNNVTDDRKYELYNTISSWYLCHTDDDMNDPGLRVYIITSINLILHGKFTMQELDWEFRALYSDIKAEDVGTAKAHRVNEIIRPFQAIFINIMQNADQSQLLFEISLKEWRDQIDLKIQTKASLYEKKFGVKNSYEAYYLFLNDLIWGCKTLNDELSNTGYVNIVNPVVGRFIVHFLNGLHYAYSENELTVDILKILVRDAQHIFYDSFAVSETTRIILNDILTLYCESGKYEDSLMHGEYFSAVKCFLNQDEAFRLWSADFHDANRMALCDRVYATYVNCFMDSTLNSVDILINSQKSDIELEYDRPPEIASEAKTVISKNNDNDSEVDDSTEDNEETSDEEEDKEYDGPEIDASQSNKGYKKGSKKQADAERKIYGAYKNYKDNESKVDSQLSKMLGAAKKAFSQDKTEEIIEGKKFTPIGLLKKILITGAIFNYSKIAGFAYLLVSHTISKKRTAKQKREILLQIETELKMLDEKIEDARGDGNRKAKYALMRTKAELERARDKIKYNLTATKEDMRVARSYISNDKRDNL